MQPCTRRDCRWASSCNCHKRRSCICLSRVVAWNLKAQVRWARETRCDLRRPGGQRVVVTESAELLVWEMHAGVKFG